MKSLILLFLSLMVISVQSQVTFILDTIPEYTPVEGDIYIAGDFNGWNPGDEEYVLEKNDEEKWSITLAAQDSGSVIHYKFTRGSWGTVEKGPSGEEIDNRSFTFGNGLTEHLTIQNWASGGGTSTVAENVHIVDENFYIPQLDRERRIWIYLPPDYNNTQLTYPVIYMHDGQNLFDEQTSFAGEWEIDETLNDLANQGFSVPIVVGIDNGGIHRISEYTPWVNPSYGGGDGDKYMAFIVETLKPFIDDNYRTQTDRDNTALMGSSLGGLISHFGSLKYQETFSKAGIFSPSYWFSDSVWSFTNQMGHQQDFRIYLMCGDMEGETTVPDMLNMADTLQTVGFNADEIKTKVVANGQHNEQLWRQEFEEAFLWLFTSFANDIVEDKKFKPLKLMPNPVENEISLVIDKDVKPKNIVILDSSGRVVRQIDILSSSKINVSTLPPGIYFIRIETNGESFTGKFVKK